MTKIKILKASSFYSSVINGLYTKYPELKHASYDKQYRTVMDQCFGFADFWKTNLENLGNFEVEEIVINNPHMQKRWAREHHIRYNPFHWELDILKYQIQEFKPDIFFSHDYKYISPQFRLTIKKNVSSIKQIIGWDGFGENNKEKFAGCDIILSCIDYALDYYKSHGFKTYLFPFGFETSILNRIKKRRPKYDISFVGSLFLTNNIHLSRLKMLNKLSQSFPLDIWIARLPFFHSTYQAIDLIRNGKWQELLMWNKLMKQNKGNAFGLNMFQILADSKITLNMHGDIVKKEAANMRLFEATGVGTCLVTDYKPNLKNYFDIDREIVTYKSLDECKEKIRWLLDHEKERKAIALAGQRKTLQYYSYERRFKEFLQYILTI
jgi:spore maturation protein CgeB